MHQVLYYNNLKWEIAMRTILLLLTLCWSLSAAAAPKVVASILPIHSLVAGVMDGVGSPTLLISANASPHAYALKPSDARALSEADLIVWVGEGLETMLERPLHSLAGKARVLELASLDGMHLLMTRELQSSHGREGVTEEESHGHDHGAIDTHLWLSPDNAQRIVSAVYTALAKLDPVNAERYRANAATLDQRIIALEKALQVQLAPVSERPYVVFHDAYRYFEEAFGLHSVAAIAVSPERSPGARRIVEIRNRIRDGAICVFSEPQFRPDIVEVVLEGSQARHGVLDPLGTSLAPGKDQWFGLMRSMANNLVDCLAE